MCGIAGLAGSVTAAEASALVRRMSDSLVHRGPDDDGLWSTDGFAFAMRRLSIIDLDGGHQPMFTRDGVGIVFNGEIYNYRSLRTELEAGGYAFRSHSDTEVILNLYHRDGIGMVARLDGMFAICIHDPREGVVHLVRDRFGVKPLYYALIDGRFFFASEIKAIVAALRSTPALDRQALHDYLTLRFVPTPATVWQGIQKLPPGHRLTYTLAGRKLHSEPYWRLRFAAEHEDHTRDYVNEFSTLFLGAVEKRLLASDVPVGVLLSGGIDSSAVSAAAVELGHRDFHTFSVAFDEGGKFDETGFAREMATHIGSRHHEVRIGCDDFVNCLPRLVRSTDEPLADLAGVPLFYVSELARQQVKVVLSGEGSDELLAGYNLEKLARMLHLLQLVQPWLPNGLRHVLSSLPLPGGAGQWFRLWAQHGWRDMCASKPLHMTHHWTEEEKGGLWLDAKGLGSTEARMRGWHDGTEHPIDRIQQVYSQDWLTEDLLMKADKMSMATSLEVREPFLDRALAEWAARLPLVWRVGSSRTGWRSKRILREFCARRLPASILARPKQGFPVPAYGWLGGRLKKWAETLLFSADSRLSGYFDLSRAKPVFLQACGGNGAAAHKVWILIVLEHWLREWQ